MDPHKDSASLQKSLSLDCDGEKNRNFKSSPRQLGVSDNVENLFTSPPNQSSSFVPMNGPRTRFVSSDINQSNKSSENNAEGVRSLAGTSQSQISKVNSNIEIENIVTPSSSKASSNSYDNGTEPNQDALSCQRHKVCLDIAGNSCNAPSTSSVNRTSDNTENTFRESRKRPSSLKLNRPNLEDDSSSDTGNDDYSLGSEDGCIYTYRGGEHLADLPSSFFSLDMGLPLDKHLPILPNYPVPQQGNREHGSRASSPDMDFLEMDFDPGPSCEVDTGDESTPNAELHSGSNMPEENEPVLQKPSPEYSVCTRYNPVNIPACASGSHTETDVNSCNVPSTSQSGIEQTENVASNHTYGPYITHINVRGEQLLVRRTMSHWPVSVPVGHHVSSGDLVSPREMLNYEDEHAERPFAYQINRGERPTFDSPNLSSVLYHLTMAKKLMAEKTNTESDTQPVGMAGDAGTEPATTSVSSIGCIEPPQCMVWSEREACERQVTQIGTSACGATAIVNVFVALGVPVNVEKINSAVGTRQRANNAPIPRYLMSRAVAGCTAADLVTGLHRASDGLVTARFFPTYPERAVSLSHWLADWISVGAVPILTLNLQVGCEGEIPDAWHHQMVFGVSPRGVYLCNPAECVRESVLWPRLTSPSVLLVRAKDIVARFTANTDLTPLMMVPDRRFHTFNVLGQVVNVIREWRAAVWSEPCAEVPATRARHVRVPAAYQPGVTVAALSGSEAHRRLALAAQLPILAPHPHPA